MEPGQPSDLMLAIPDWIDKAGQSGVLPIAALCGLAMLVVMDRSERWRSFAVRGKATGRFAIAVSVALLCLPALALQDKVIKYVPTRVSFERPDLPSVAIERGIYGLYLERELTASLTPDRAALVRCAYAAASRHAKAAYNGCVPGACHAPTTMTRDELKTEIAELRAQQTANGTRGAAAICAGVDIGAL